MSILKIARMGHPVLRARARAVEPSQIRSPEFQRLIDDMFETMQEYQGVGLAAPQVHQGVRLFVAGFAPRHDDDDDDDEDGGVPLMALINPEITVVGDDMQDDWEGCLSIPDVRGRVNRARDISVKAYDRKGRRIHMDARGFTARVIQHETDHLNGIVYLDRMRDLSSLSYIAEWQKHWLGIREQQD